MTTQQHQELEEAECLSSTRAGNGQETTSRGSLLCTYHNSTEDSRKCTKYLS